MTVVAGVRVPESAARPHPVRARLFGLVAVVLAAAAVVGVQSAPPAGAAAVAPGGGPLTTAGRWLVDEQGRVVLTHGVNVVAKHAPYSPSSLGFDAEDADFLASEGFDSVRLGIIWKAVEPQPGVYDDAYLADVRETARMLQSAGLRVLLDSHQDMYHERFQGEFAPDWAVTVQWDAVPRLGFPGNQFVQPALMAQYDQFLANVPGPGGVGLLDRYASMWGHVAGFFSDEGLMGYDLLNEPWAGTAWVGCMTDGFCGPQKEGLARLHAGAGQAIRARDAVTPVFYEPFSSSNPGAPVHAPAPNVPGQALSFHTYCAPAIQLGLNLGCDVMDEHTISLAQARAAADRAPALLTEFGAKKNPETIFPVVRAAERQLLGWQFWAYCDCGDPTTSGPGEQGLVVDARVPDPAAHADQGKLGALVAPHARGVAGTPTATGYDPASGRFTLSWNAVRADGSGSFPAWSETLVAVPRRAYPAGYTATVTGGVVTSDQESDVLAVRSTGTGPVSVTLARAQ